MAMEGVVRAGLGKGDYGRCELGKMGREIWNKRAIEMGMGIWNRRGGEVGRRPQEL